MAHPLPLRTDLDGGCVDCGKPGRPRRAPRGGESLIVCDLHAQLFDLDGATDDDYVQVREDPNPVVDYRAEASVFTDELDLWARHLVACGIRWYLVRWIPRTERKKLFYETLLREEAALPGTRPASEGSTVWLDHAYARIDRQGWQARKAAKFRAYARAQAASVDPGGPPITRGGVTMPELCAALGCTDRYIQQVIEPWFRAEGLLLVLVRGTRAPRMEAPCDETPEEAEAREAREEARTAANRCRIAEARAHLQAELAAAQAGTPAPAPPDSFAPFREALDLEHAPAPLINIAQVYQLRLPVAPDARDAPSQPAVVGLAERRRQRRAQAQREAILAIRDGAVPPPVEPVAGLAEQKFGPNVPRGKEESLQFPGAVVEERPASRGSYDEGACPSGGSNQPRRRERRHVRAARRLLGRLQSAQGTPAEPLLPRHLCRDVTLVNLAHWIRGHVDAGLSDEELVLVITSDGGRWRRPPEKVRNPAGFIRNALARWSPTGPRPVDQATRRKCAAAVDELEHENERERYERAARGRRIAIDACSRCDEDGWEQLDGAGPAVRCDHRPVDEDQALDDVDPVQPLTSGEAVNQVRDQLCARGSVTALRSRLLAEAEASRAVEQDQGNSGTGYRSKRARKKWGK
jgi:hypothetical protein